jgi:hypothetical protein
MGLDAMLQKCTYAGYQVWAWLRYEIGLHPFMFLAAVIIIIAAFILYKTEVRSK